MRRLLLLTSVFVLSACGPPTPGTSGAAPGALPTPMLTAHASFTFTGGAAFVADLTAPLPAYGTEPPFTTCQSYAAGIPANPKAAAQPPPGKAGPDGFFVIPGVSDPFDSQVTGANFVDASGRGVGVSYGWFPWPGPGTYADAAAHGLSVLEVTVGSDPAGDFDGASAHPSLVVNPDGSGSLTFANLPNRLTARSPSTTHLSGTITWTCKNG